MTDTTDKMIVLKTDGTTEVVELPTLEDELATLQHAVGDGLIEAITLGSLNIRLFVNEEGKNLLLPPNRVASAIWSSVYPVHMLNDFIVGDVVITSDKSNDEGDLIGLTDDEVLNWILKIKALSDVLLPVKEEGNG